MRIIKAILFSFLSLLFLFAAAILRFASIGLDSSVSERTCAQLTSAWGITMLRLLNISVTTVFNGKNTLRNGVLVVSNHQSYLDIIIAASVHPMIFVAKNEVRSWMLFGWMASLGGTIFIDRNSVRKGFAATAAVSQSLQRGVSVHIFPEATSTDGSRLLPFKPMLFTSALESRTPILPMTIRYRNVDGNDLSFLNRDVVCWYGTMEFFPHFIRLMRCTSVSAEVIVHPELSVSPNDTPRSLAERSFAAIASA
ncbi:MAG: lysophospholipid acyltransferase family protein [Bacteroidota bacterium]